ALASPLAHYAAGFLTEPLSALCLLLVALGLVGAGRDGPAWPGALLSGAAAGLAVATKVANLLLVAPAVVWLLWLAWSRRRAGRPWRAVVAAWILPFLAWLAAIGWANRVRFGSAWETGYGAEAGSFGTPLLEGIGGLLLSPGRGLLWYWPAALLALAGLARLSRRAPATAAYAAAAFVLSLLLYGRFYQWYGGGSWGPRFLIPVLPLLALGLALLAERAARSPRSRVATLAFAFTVVAGLALSALLVARSFESQMPEAILADPEALAASLWEPQASPLVAQVRLVAEGPPPAELPFALRVRGALRWPALAAPLTWDLDLAASRYRSWRMLRWSYTAATAGLAALAAGLWLARRSRGSI
ncbi:MAG TPA: hypothetical protein VLA75_11215, partial [Thermoanaerobaculia bacterium]|nr:hypothetical protein [Thermoanaerobaculia bacterium]